MKTLSPILLSLASVAGLAACTESPTPSTSDAPATQEAAAPGNDHDEVPLESVTLGDHLVALKQGHGAMTGGKESHLVVTLPYSDEGSTVVRAWIGVEDRTQSYVGLGEYAADHGDYDVHATAPDPLPANARWWVEIEQPDGTKLVGSAAPILE